MADLKTYSISGDITGGTCNPDVLNATLTASGDIAGFAGLSVQGDVLIVKGTSFISESNVDADVLAHDGTPTVNPDKGVVPISITSGVSGGAASSGFLAATNNKIEYEIQGSGAGASKVIYYSVIVPQNYSSGGSINVDSWTNDFTNLTTWTVTGYIDGTVDSSLSAVDITPTANSVYQTTSDDFADTIAAGDVLMVKLDFTGSNGDNIRIDKIEFEYNK